MNTPFRLIPPGPPPPPMPFSAWTRHDKDLVEVRRPPICAGVGIVIWSVRSLATRVIANAEKF